MSRPRNALSFGAAAERYEQYREGYPDEIVDIILDYAGRELRAALEVGAGTGKATRVFAGRGIDVTALEPDPGMLAVLERTTAGLPVHPVTTTFEAYETDRRFELLYSAAAWHWTDPATRWTRATGLLVPGGVLAVFGRPSRPVDEELRAAIDAIEDDLAPGESGRHRWSAEDLENVDGLVDATTVERPTRRTVPAAEFVGRMSTVSRYLVLDAVTRSEALHRVARVVPAEVVVETTLRMMLARRP